MENSKIYIRSHGSIVQTYDYDCGDEENKHTISLLWCNIQKWVAQPNHYDLLHPTEEAKKDKSFNYKFIENHDALQMKCNIEANQISNYIGRRSKDEMER
eukprot:7838745-Heterocapsa_arctica.AAC.1